MNVYSRGDPRGRPRNGRPGSNVYSRGDPRSRPGNGRPGSNEWLKAKNILAVRLDNIGDVIMLGPALRAVKESSPRARLTLLVTPGGAAAAPLLPWIDDVIVWRPI